MFCKERIVDVWEEVQQVTVVFGRLAIPASFFGLQDRALTN